MRFHALACDYDGTIAHHGRVDEPTIAALERVRASGRRLLLVSGRELDDLQGAFPRLDLFHRAVVENGALIFDPATRAVRLLGEAPPQAFVEALDRRGVRPLSIGRVIAATWQPNENAVLDAIRELGLELQVVFNKGAVMVLPSGINKATGLRAALDDLSLSPHNVVGIGDAENDHAFLTMCECGVAVANALPLLKERADWVTAGDHGAGVRELIDELLDDDLQRLGNRLVRSAFTIGQDAAGTAVTMHPYDTPLLIAGTSGAGKSTLATSMLEQLADRDYQFCVVDPEGDYTALEMATQAGDGKRAPTVPEVLEILAKPGRSAVANLLGLPLADRPALFTSLLARLLELRQKTGRPHWIVIDEAHHLLPDGLDTSALALPRESPGLLLLTVHPGSVAAAVLATVGTAIAIGATPRDTLAAFAAAVGAPAPEVPAEPLAPGHGIAWLRHARPGAPPVLLKLRPPRTEHLRHVRKYAVGDLGPEISFYFRGAEGKLNLRAQNLQVFLQLAEGVDDDTWLFHLRQGDVSRWFRERIKDEELASVAEAVERDAALPAAGSRSRIKAAVEQRYTAHS